MLVTLLACWCRRQIFTAAFVALQAKLELWEIRQYHERIERERALEREKKEHQEALRLAAEARAAALQRKQQEQQARQQQQNLLKMNKKKVQNAIKTQQRKVTVIKPSAVNQPVLLKPTVATPPVPAGALPRALPVVRPVGVSAPSKLAGVQTIRLTPQIRASVVPRTPSGAVGASMSFTPRVQPRPSVPQQLRTSILGPVSRVNLPIGSVGTAGTFILFSFRLINNVLNVCVLK